MSEKTETKTNFDQTASPLKGIKNIMTPAGVVMRVTDTDLKWFTHFYTFEAQGKKCYQSIKTIAKEFDRAVSVAQERIDKLQALGLLDVGKEPFKDGWRNTYTCTPIDVIVSRMTEAPVTPQYKPLKKSQLNSLLKKSGKVDSHAVNRGIKAMAKTIANRDLSDEEVMQFAFQIATEKLAALGWPIESIIEESNDEDDLQPATDGPETASPAAGEPDGVPVVDIPVDADLSGSDDPSLSDSTGRNVVELPRNGRPKLSFKFVSPDDDDLENYSEAPQVDFDKDGQPPNKWKDFDMATTCDLLYDL
ncbi:hypothetical protein ACXDKC_004946 [Klebsiella pneumoniae]